MNWSLIAAVLRRRRQWRARDSWTRQQLLSFQSARFEQLRDHALTASPFYRRHWHGLERAPLAQLPPVTKPQLMADLDRVFTTSGLTRQRLTGWLDTAAAADGDLRLPYGGRWYAARTGGTSGEPGLFAWDRHEWADVLTSYARANDWAGIRAGVLHPLRTVLVSSHDPTHASAVVGATLRSPLVPTLRKDAGDPIEQITAAIEEFRPRLLVGYASAMRAVAEAKLAGAMPHVRPDAVVSASEVLSAPARAIIERAWRVPVLDVYAATETAGVASPCHLGTRHLYEDLLICEPVDERYNLVPPGQPSAQLLVTVLFARTVPLIRYVLDDRVANGPAGCACRRPHAVLQRVEGRTEDQLALPRASAAGTVTVHPIVLHHALDTAALGPWQVRWDGAQLSVDVVAGTADLDAVKRSLTAELASRGVVVDVAVRRVDAPRRSRLGKIRLVTDLTAPPGDG